MNKHAIPAEEEAIKAAIDHLKSISFLGRLVADQPTVTFYDGAGETERHNRDFPDAPMHPRDDYWIVSFPLIEPVPEIESDSRYVIVNAVNGKCMLGLP